MSVILASKSAARAALLRAAGVPFEVRGSGVDEGPLKARWLADGADPHAIASRLAEAKALALSCASEALVIGADQTLDLDGRLIDKPADLAEAGARLLELRGRPHQLHSAVVLARAGRVIWRDTPTATLHVRHFSDAWLDEYLAQAGPGVLQTVGGYELEGLGVQLFEAIEGDWFAILGLPMIGLLHALRREGVLAR
jgi:septum formation protein